jgi:hypothetical protein
MLGFQYFYMEKCDGMLAFLKKLTKKLINNTYLQEEASNGPRRSPRSILVGEHDVYHLPVGKKFFTAEVVNAASKNAPWRCISCRKKALTCCNYTVGLY